jgi:hypothetical protein
MFETLEAAGEDGEDGDVDLLQPTAIEINNSKQLAEICFMIGFLLPPLGAGSCLCDGVNC